MNSNQNMNDNNTNQKKRKNIQFESEQVQKHSKNLYKQLDDLLTKKRQQFLDQGHRFAYKMTDIQTREDFLKAQSSLKIAGCVGIIDICDQESIDFARRLIGEGFSDLYKGRIPDEKLDDWKLDPKNFDLHKVRQSKCIFHAKDEVDSECNWCMKGPCLGNIGFGFLFSQLGDKEELPLFDVGLQQKIKVENQPMHRYNLNWLEKNPRVLDLVMAFGYRFENDEYVDTKRQPPMISWDSTKYVYDPFSGTKKELTKHHFDHYSDDEKATERRQCALEFSQEYKKDQTTRRLGYVPFTNDKEVQQLISEIFETTTQKSSKGISGQTFDVQPSDRRPLGLQSNFFNRVGFISMDKDERLVEILNKHSISFNGNHLAEWQDGVVHFEGFFEKDPNDNFLCRLKHRKLIRKEKAECIRMIVGTHRPTLEKDQLEKFAFLLDRGFMPTIYHSNTLPQIVKQNLMCSKITQYKKKRLFLQHEKDNFKKVEEFVENKQSLKQYLDNLSIERKAMYGLSFHDPFKLLLNK